MADPDTGVFIWYELMTPDPDAELVDGRPKAQNIRFHEPSSRCS